MDTANSTPLIKETVLSFLGQDYPLIRLFRYGSELLVYDAKPHLAFILSDAEMDVLIDFVRNVPQDELIAAHSANLGKESVRRLCTQFAKLKNSGVFLKGPAEEISPVDREALQNQLSYYDESILLRKFCLGVTEDCNFRCTYCKRTVGEKYQTHSKINLSEEHAYQSIQYYFGKYISFFQKLPGEKQSLLLQISPPSLSWYGGEPFLNFSLMKKTAEYFKNLPWEKYGIPTSSLRFTSNTNLSIMNDEILHFLLNNRVALFASLDGPAGEHDKCRVFENGSGTFQVAYPNLMKIKKYNGDYFKNCVSIFGVYTTQHDFNRCIDFTRGLGALLCQHFPAEYTGTFVPDAETSLLKFHDSLEERLAEFDRRACAAAANPGFNVNEFANLFPFATMNFDHPDGSNFLRVLLTCPMAFDNLMVAANGDYLICHKVDDSMPVGHCDTGLDFEKLADLYQQYGRTVNNQECRNCWSVNFCTVCAATRMADGHFINPTRQECDSLRQRTAYDFTCFIWLSLNHPDLLEKIFEHRRDRKNFLGVIDIHDF